MRATIVIIVRIKSITIIITIIHIGIIMTRVVENTIEDRLDLTLERTEKIEEEMTRNIITIRLVTLKRALLYLLKEEMAIKSEKLLTN
jgi:hypothetical protein